MNARQKKTKRNSIKTRHKEKEQRKDYLSNMF